MFRFPKLRAVAAEQLYSFLLLVPLAENDAPQDGLSEPRRSAFTLRQQQIEDATEVLIGTPWVQLARLTQQQVQQREVHPCERLAQLLDLEAEWREVGVLPF